MNAAAESLYDHALQLPDADRAELAARLIASLDADIDEDADASWSDEIQRRLAEIDNGVIQGVPWPEARRMIFGSADGQVAD